MIADGWSTIRLVRFGKGFGRMALELALLVEEVDVLEGPLFIRAWKLLEGADRVVELLVAPLDIVDHILLGRVEVKLGINLLDSVLPSVPLRHLGHLLEFRGFRLLDDFVDPTRNSERFKAKLT